MSWQAQHFVNLEVQIPWQGQRLVQEILINHVSENNVATSYDAGSYRRKLSSQFVSFALGAWAQRLEEAPQEPVQARPPPHRAQPKLDARRRRQPKSSDEERLCKLMSFRQLSLHHVFIFSFKVAPTR